MPLSNVTARWSIGAKLYSGFAILVLLSLVVGAIGIMALDRYGARSLIVAETSSIEAAVLEARTDEKNFLIRGEQEFLDQNTAAIDLAARQLASLQNNLVVPADLARVEAMLDGIRDYRKEIALLAQASREQAAQVGAIEAAALAIETQLAEEQALFEVDRAFATMRQEERKFLLEHDSGAPARFRALIDDVTSALNSSYAEPDAKQQVREQFQAYTAAFSAALGARQTTEAQELKTVDIARAILADAVALQELQLEKMVNDKSQATWFIVIVVAAVLLIGSVLGWLLARSITRPIHEAVTLASKVASGDLSQNVQSHRGDEFGQLMSALDTMVVNLRDLVGNIETNSSQIAASAEQLSTVTERTSAGVAQQRDQTDQVATAMNEMVATANDVAHNAGEASSAASQASEKAKTGETAVRETLGHVTELNDKVIEVMGSLQALQADTKNIGTVLDVIKSVAEQTNLLALNAAIEAARAGEQGRGFAVVADEVRSLAQRTQTSATEIETLIKTLVTSADSSMNTMTVGSDLAQKTLDKAHATGEQIREITEAVDEINRVNSQIATAAEQQTAVSDEINQNVTLIRDVSDRSSGDAKEVASTSQELARLGKELRGLVARFRT